VHFVGLRYVITSVNCHVRFPIEFGCVTFAQNRNDVALISVPTFLSKLIPLVYGTSRLTWMHDKLDEGFWWPAYCLQSCTFSAVSVVCSFNFHSV